MGWIDIGIFLNLFFNGLVLFKEPFEFYIGYAPLIFLLFVFIAKYRFPRETLYVLIPLLITGVLNVFIGNNNFNNLFKIFVNVAVNVVFYRYVIIYYENDVKKVFSMYLKFAYIVAFLGMIQWVSYQVGFIYGYNWKYFLPLNKWMVNPGGFGIRINSTLSEPSYFGTIMAPAFFMSFYELFFNREKFQSRSKSILIVITYILSSSSLAFIGVFISVVLLAANFGLVRYVLVAIPIVVVLYFVAYNNNKEFKARVDGLQALFVDNIIENELSGNLQTKARIYKVNKLLPKIHGSSFVLYNNYHVAIENFKQNPLFGSGLGSHEIAFKTHKLNYLIAGIYEFNTADANSMLLRTISELGLMGVIFIFAFIFKFYVSKNIGGSEDEDYWLISNALLILIIIQLLRQGNYTFSGFMLYGWMYYFNRVNYMSYIEKKNAKNAGAEEENNEVDANIPVNQS